MKSLNFSSPSESSTHLANYSYFCIMTCGDKKNFKQMANLKQASERMRFIFFNLQLFERISKCIKLQHNKNKSYIHSRAIFIAHSCCFYATYITLTGRENMFTENRCTHQLHICNTPSKPCNIFDYFVRFLG